MEVTREPQVVSAGHRHDELGLSFHATAAMPDVRRHVVDLPRVALFHTWTSTQDAGWARYTLEQAKLDYTLINDDDMKRGGLEDIDGVAYFRKLRAAIEGGLAWLDVHIDRTRQRLDHLSAVPDQRDFSRSRRRHARYAHALARCSL